MNSTNVKNWSETISYTAKPLIDHKANQRVYLTKNVKPNAIQKYKVSEIVDISKKQLINAVFHYKVSGELSEKDFSNYTSIIKESTLAIIKSREAKRNTGIKKLFRSIGMAVGILLTASAVGAILGLPIIYSISKSNKDFKKEIENLKRQLNIPTEKSQIIKEYILNHPQATKIAKFIKEDLPVLVSNEASNNEKLKNLQDDLLALSNTSPEYIEEKRKGDFLGGTSFLRRDTIKNINDKRPLPKTIFDDKTEFKKNFLIKKADKSLKKLLTPNDHQWEKPLKVLTNQLLAKNCLEIKGQINYVLKNYQWKEEGKDFALQVSNSQPAIELNIIRDESQDIQQIDVRLVGHLNLEAKNIGAGDEESELIIPSLLEVEMKFSSKIDVNGQLIISDLKFNYKLKD